MFRYEKKSIYSQVNLLWSLLYPEERQVFIDEIYNPYNVYIGKIF